jgi:hypothetical protein
MVALHEADGEGDGLVEEIDRAAYRLARLIARLPQACRPEIEPLLDALADTRAGHLDERTWRRRAAIRAEERRLVTAGVSAGLARLLAGYALRDGESPQDRQVRLRAREYNRHRKRAWTTKQQWLNGMADVYAFPGMEGESYG